MVPDQENVGSLLDKIAEYRTGVGMKYLEEAVRRVLEKGEFPAKGLMQLYGEIGAPDGVSDRTVSRAIAKSVKQILEYGKLQVLLNRIGMNDVTCLLYTSITRKRGDGKRNSPTASFCCCIYFAISAR